MQLILHVVCHIWAIVIHAHMLCPGLVWCSAGGLCWVLIYAVVASDKLNWYQHMVVVALLMSAHLSHADLACIHCADLSPADLSHTALHAANYLDLLALIQASAVMAWLCSHWQRGICEIHDTACYCGSDCQIVAVHVPHVCLTWLVGIILAPYQYGTGRCSGIG